MHWTDVLLIVQRLLWSKDTLRSSLGDSGWHRLSPVTQHQQVNDDDLESAQELVGDVQGARQQARGCPAAGTQAEGRAGAAARWWGCLAPTPGEGSTAGSWGRGHLAFLVGTGSDCPESPNWAEKQVRPEGSETREARCTFWVQEGARANWLEVETERLDAVVPGVRVWQ